MASGQSPSSSKPGYAELKPLLGSSLGHSQDHATSRLGSLMEAQVGVTAPENGSKNSSEASSSNSSGARRIEPLLSAVPSSRVTGHIESLLGRIHRPDASKGKQSESLVDELEEGEIREAGQAPDSQAQSVQGELAADSTEPPMQTSTVSAELSIDSQNLPTSVVPEQVPVIANEERPESLVIDGSVQPEAVKEGENKGEGDAVVPMAAVPVDVSETKRLKEDQVSQESSKVDGPAATKDLVESEATKAPSPVELSVSHPVALETRESSDASAKSAGSKPTRKVVKTGKVTPEPSVVVKDSTRSMPTKRTSQEGPTAAEVNQHQHMEAMMMQQQQQQQQMMAEYYKQQQQQMAAAEMLMMQQQAESMLKQQQQQQQRQQASSQQYQQQPSAADVLLQQHLVHPDQRLTAAESIMLQQHQQQMAASQLAGMNPSQYPGALPASSPLLAMSQGQTNASSQQQARAQQQPGQQYVPMETHMQMVVYLATTQPHLLSLYCQQTGLNPAYAQAILAQAGLYGPQMMQTAQTQSAPAVAQASTGSTKRPPTPIPGSQTVEKRPRSDSNGTGQITKTSSVHSLPSLSQPSARSQSPLRMASSAMDEGKSVQSVLASITAASAPRPQTAAVSDVPSPSRHPLSDAILRGDVMLLRSVLPANTHSINTLNEQGTTALIVAASYPDWMISLECVKLLLTFGALGRVRDRQGFTAAHWAAAMDNVESLKAILNSDRQLVEAPCSKKGDSPLHRASRAGKAKAVRVLITEFNSSPWLLNNEYETAVEVAGKVLDAEDNTQLSAQYRQQVRNVLFEVAPYARTLVLFHPDCLLHETSEGHQESPERIKAIFKKLNSSEGAVGLVVSDDFERASLEAVARAHDPEYVQFVIDLDAQLKRDKSSQPVAFTPRVQKAMFGIVNNKLKPELSCDTMFSPGSLTASLRAAGSVMRAIDIVLSGMTRNAFCAVRPPGHHAGTKGLLDDATSCGFCIFNSVMVGAMHALSAYPTTIHRVAVIDFDVHHGNGSQDIIKQRIAPFSKDAVLLFSIHLYDREDDSSGDKTSGELPPAPGATRGRASYEFYPGSGAADVWDKNIYNVPIMPLWKDSGISDAVPASTSRRTSSFSNELGVAQPSSPSLSGRQAFRRAIRNKMLPLVRAYRPDLILVSAGFDAALNDVGCCKTTSDGRITSGADLKPEDFDYITKQIVKVANVCCQGRVVSVLEGGYGCVQKMMESSTASSAGSANDLNREGFADCVASHVLGLSGMSTAV